VGTFSLTINGNQECGQTTTIDISSTGTANDNPLYTRTITGRYTRPSVAEYSYIVNTNVWAGADRVITGKYHSNGGVRMDGSNNSTVESSVSTWQCTSSFGCSGTQTKNGVFGAGSNPALWKYPVPQIDFAGITVDLTAMKTYAKNNGGLYFGPVGGESGKRGYHAIFKADGTVDVDNIFVLSKNSKKEYKVRTKGGGTSFQCCVDYILESKKYEGYIICTDGFCSKPDETKIKRMWILLPETKLGFETESTRRRTERQPTRQHRQGIRAADLAGRARRLCQGAGRRQQGI
jgi:hypothetical protein